MCVISIIQQNDAGKNNKDEMFHMFGAGEDASKNLLRSAALKTEEEEAGFTAWACR